MNRLWAATLALLLAGCGTTDLLSGRRIDYKSASTLPPLEIPPDLTAPGRDNRYVVPDTQRSSATLSQFESQQRGGQVAQPGAQRVLPVAERMRIERNGNQRWLVVPDTPDRIWQIVREFWQDNGFMVEIDNPEAGVMETAWAENRARIPQDFIRQTIGRFLDQLYSTGERDKFRTRLERGAEPGTTEIYVSHRGMVEVFTSTMQDRTAWTPRPADPELEAEFLKRLMMRLGVTEQRAGELIAQQAAPALQRARITKAGDGSDRLEVLESFDRAWRRVGLALDRVGFTVEDRDRQKGLYFVRYADPEANPPKPTPGMLDRIAFWRPNTPSQVRAEQFRVMVAPGSEVSVVQVLNRDGVAVNSQTSRRILALLHEQLR